MNSISYYAVMNKTQVEHSKNKKKDNGMVQWKKMDQVRIAWFCSLNQMQTESLPLPETNKLGNGNQKNETTFKNEQIRCSEEVLVKRD